MRFLLGGRGTPARWLRAVALAWFVFSLRAVPLPGAERGQVISTFGEFFGQPVDSDAVARIPAVATYVNVNWKMLFAQDETAGCLIREVAPTWDFEPGERLLIEGRRTNPSATNPVHVLRDVTVHRLGPGPLPPPLAATGAELDQRAFEARWVEVRGRVRAVVELPQAHLTLRVDERTLSVWIRRHRPADLRGLLDAEVTVQGVCNQNRFEATAWAEGTHLLVDDFRTIHVDRPGPDDPFALPRTPIAQLAAPNDGAPSAARRLVKGRVVTQEQGVSLTLRDESGTLRVLSPLQITLAKEDTVEAIGYPGRERDEWVLSDAMFRRLESASAAGQPVMAAQARTELPVLRSLKAVAELSRTDAERQYPLQVTGVVTHLNPSRTALFLQDGEHALYVSLMSQATTAKLGQTIGVSGVAKPGGILPMISPASIQVLGEGSLPPAPLMSSQAGMTGMFDCRRVRVRGVVQSTSWADNLLNLDLVADDGRFWCTLPAPTDTPLRTNLINVFAEVEGICILNVDRLGRPASLEIAIQRERDIRVERVAAAAELEARPLSIGDLQLFISPALATRRLKVQGAVTFWRPGREFYLEDSSGAVCVQSDQTNTLAVGDVVEAIGYRAWGESAALLKNAEYRVLSSGQPPPAIPLRANQALDLTYRERLVRVEAVLRNDTPASAAPELVLEDGPDLFTARLEPLSAGRLWPAFRAQSRLRVTGICGLRLDAAQEPRAFRLLVRDPADIRVVKPPPWFTAERVVALVGLLLLCVCVALAWVAALRRRVADQTRQIRVRLESEAATERRLALVWEAAADGMALTDAEGTVVQVNAAYCQMVQRDRGLLEDRPFAEAFRAADRPALQAAYREQFRSRTATPMQAVQRILWNERAVWFEHTTRFIERAEGSPLLLSQFRDVTERRLAEREKTRLQEQLIQAQKTESIGRLAGGVAHDFNNMLQVILGNTQLVLEETPDSSPLHEAMREIQRSAQRSAELTRQLLAFARKQTAHPRVLDLNEAVAALLKMLRRLIGEHIQLVWIPAPQVGPVRIDPVQVDQVLVNLCVNARDAIQTTGKITIETDRAAFDTDSARWHADCLPGEYVVLAVSDTGCGMSAATREHVFEPFFTTKDLGKGTGLGLATVFGIVKQNLGFIDVQSELGQGTAFRIYLPRSPEVVSAASSPPSSSWSRGGETILLVEDEAQILELGRRILLQQGYRVLTALNPAAAMELVRTSTDPIHLLITDVVMPGMNGDELRRQVQALRPGIRCLFMSGYAADVIASGDTQGPHCLPKPFTIGALTQSVRQALESERNDGASVDALAQGNTENIANG